jgi:mannose-6-phosphate isomerase-like protein (cupin superfamily)
VIVRTVTLDTAPRIPETVGFTAHRLHATDHVEVVHIDLAPGKSIVRHAAPVDSFFYVLSGAATVEVGAERVTLPAGALLASRARTPHKVWNHSPDPLRFLVVKTPKPLGPPQLFE